MEILRSVILLGIVMVHLSPVIARGQDTQMTRAFEASYSYELSHDYDKAFEALKVVYDESSYEVNARLGWLSYLNGSYIESMNYYQKAISLKPYAIEPRLGYALPASSLGSWELVKGQYLKILEIDPMNTYAHYRLGLIAYNREEYEKAAGHFEKVVNLFPFDYDSMIMYAWTNYKLGKLREAKVLFQKALLIKPNDESATEGLGLIQ